jgi:hypothetical protein
MHLDEHVEGIDAEYGGGGGGGKHGETVRCGERNTVIGTARAWSCDRMDFTLLVRMWVAHLSAVQRSLHRRNRVAAWRIGFVSDRGGAHNDDGLRAPPERFSRERHLSAEKPERFKTDRCKRHVLLCVHARPSMTTQRPHTTRRTHGRTR